MPSSAGTLLALGKSNGVALPAMQTIAEVPSVKWLLKKTMGDDIDGLCDLQTTTNQKVSDIGADLASLVGSQLISDVEKRVNLKNLYSCVDNVILLRTATPARFTTVNWQVLENGSMSFTGLSEKQAAIAREIVRKKVVTYCGNFRSLYIKHLRTVILPKFCKAKDKNPVQKAIAADLITRFPAGLGGKDVAEVRKHGTTPVYAWAKSKYAQVLAEANNGLSKLENGVFALKDKNVTGVSEREDALTKYDFTDAAQPPKRRRVAKVSTADQEGLIQGVGAADDHSDTEDDENVAGAHNDPD